MRGYRHDDSIHGLALKFERELVVIHTKLMDIGTNHPPRLQLRSSSQSRLRCNFCLLESSLDIEADS